VRRNAKATDQIMADLDSRSGKWLRSAAKDMASATVKDWKDWKRAYR
jgi:hypothetical protein